MGNMEEQGEQDAQRMLKREPGTSVSGDAKARPFLQASVEQTGHLGRGTVLWLRFCGM